MVTVERCPSGRRCRPGTSVWGNSPRVRIPSSQPYNPNNKLHYSDLINPIVLLSATLDSCISSSSAFDSSLICIFGNNFF